MVLTPNNNKTATSGNNGRLLLFRLNQMLYYALCLSYYSNTEAVLFAKLSSGWATTTGSSVAGGQVGARAPERISTLFTVI